MIISLKIIFGLYEVFIAPLGRQELTDRVFFVAVAVEGTFERCMAMRSSERITSLCIIYCPPMVRDTA